MFINIVIIINFNFEGVDWMDEEIQLFSKIVESSDDAIISKSLDGVITSWNKGAELIYGYSAEEIVGKNISILAPPQLKDEVNQLINKIKDGEKVNLYDTVRISKDSKEVDVSISLSPIFDNSGNLIGISTIARDITKQKKLEITLKESEEKYRSIFENSMDAVLLTKPNGTILDVNPAGEKLFGYSKNEMIELGRQGIIDSDDPRLPALIEVREDKGKAKGELIFVKKDGSKFSAELSSNIFREKDGIEKTIMVISDISDRLKALEFLRKSESDLLMAQNLGHLGSWDWNIQKNTLEWSKELYNIFAVDKDFEFTFESIENMIHQEDRENNQAIVNGLIKHDDKVEYEFRIIRPNGEIRYIHQIINVVNRDENGNAKKAFGIMQDITKQKKAENDRLESEEFLENIIENIPEVIFVKNADNLDFKKVNKAAEDLFGHSRDKLIGNTDYDFFTNDQADFFTRKDREVIKSKQLLDIPEEIIETKKLGQRVLHTKKIPIFNKKGNPQYLLGISEDITERKIAEKSLADAYLTVKNQAAELIAANVVLKAEIKERKRMEIIIRDNVLRMNLALESADMGALDLDIVNDTSIRTLDHDKIFGYDSLLPEWGLKIFFEHVLPDDREYVHERFEKSYETNKLYFQCRIIRADKQIRWIEAYGNVYKDNEGVPIRVLGVVSDITERKKTEIQLLAVIGEKELLLREIHHRVKNNMQIISSLLNLQSSQVFDKRDADLFTVVQDRVKSMGLIHGNLYQSEDLSSIKLKDYINTLASELLNTYAANSNIKLVTHIEDISLNIETAIPLGLIINELVTNSLKHAFPDSKGEISIDAHIKGEEIVLIIKDNGMGLPSDFEIKNPKKLGFKLVNSLVEQIESTIELDRSQRTEFKIKFKELKYKERI
jgi:PAS domain S-box-containing protein